MKRNLFALVVLVGLAAASASRQGTMAAQKALPASEKYADEQVKSSFAYPKSYKVKPIAEQIKILRQLFPGIGSADEKLAQQPLPPNAEGWFAIPKWQKIAPTYNEAVEKILATIASKRTFFNYRPGAIGPEFLRQHARTVKMVQALADQQKDHDILVVPAQFGLRHRGRSVRRARELFQADEFGLDAFAVGCMLLTHPRREVQWDKQLHVYCAGDEYSPAAGGDFTDVPIFYHLIGDVKFSSDEVAHATERYGSASAFLPQE